MFEAFTIVTPQLDFPNADLSSDNADLLELVLSNSQLVEAAHVTAEGASWAFRLGHIAVMGGANRHFQHADAQALAAVDGGIVAFEALTSILQGSHVSADMASANREFLKLTEADSEDVDAYIESSLADFKASLPNTTEVISSSMQRFHGPLTDFALLGAAMSRRFNLDSASAAA